jgi:hypothetical protein
MDDCGYIQEVNLPITTDAIVIVIMGLVICVGSSMQL